MKYTTEVIINLSLKRGIELFDNPSNLDKWMAGLKSFEPIQGTTGQPEAKLLLNFGLGPRKIEMIETIFVRNLPAEFTGTYEASGLFNILKNSFVAVNERATKYSSESKFRFKGIMWFLVSFMKGAFKKQSFRYLENFKTCRK